MRVLITGGTGSLGNALVQFYLSSSNHRIIVFSRDELKQSEMRVRFPDPRVEFFLGDVRDVQRLKLAFSAVDTVIHAAALKRVDSVAHDPDEVFKTNVEGSRNVLHAARGRVRKVLLISSDKACYPINTYGVSKAMAEHLFTSFNVYGYPCGTRSSAVRYGNVLGSRGSVLHLWKSQAALGEPLTLTLPGMTRFIITLSEACSLVEHALREMEGGEIFVPGLKAARMEDLADAVGTFEGLAPRIEWVGLRPGGEKKHEVLLTQDEGMRLLSVFPHVIQPHLTPWRSHKWHYGETTLRTEKDVTSEHALKYTVLELIEKLKEVA